MLAMDNYRDNFTVTFVDYENDINELIKENDGLKSRVALTFKLEQFTPLELAEIANNMLIEQKFVTSNIYNSLWNTKLRMVHYKETLEMYET